jgi:hypothetical protein
MFSGLTDPCSSQQEDLPFDADSVGLDNDGDGAADYPADSDCPAPATPTPTPTPAAACGASRATGCIASGKGSSLLVDEKEVGKEKLNVTLNKLQVAVTQGQFGDPVSVNGTAYAVCLYDAADILRGQYSLVQAGATCGDKPCWKAVSDKGYMYKDKDATADGIVQAQLSGGDAGKGKIKFKGKNSSGNLPTGVVAGLMQNPSGATVQILSSDGTCFGTGLTVIKKADGTVFHATGP